jgi:hypothetical protein
LLQGLAGSWDKQRKDAMCLTVAFFAWRHFNQKHDAFLFFIHSEGRLITVIGHFCEIMFELMPDKELKKCHNVM